MKYFFVFLAFSVMLLTSCSPQLSTFTRDIYTDQNLTDNDLKKIQFFLSDDIVLYRYLEEGGNYQINEGALRVRNGKKTQEVVIKAGTPGVFVERPKDDHFSISFEQNDDSKFLTFGPNPKNGGYYELLATSWSKRSGTVTYANEKFTTWSDVIPRLLVDLKQTRTETIERTKAGGRRVQK
jgi:hypothetical protein